MNKMNWLTFVLVLYWNAIQTKGFNSEIGVENCCGQVYDLDEGQTYAVRWFREILKEPFCKIGFKGQGSYMIDRYRVCIEKINCESERANIIEVDTTGHNQKRTKYNCTNLPSKLCGEFDNIIYLSTLDTIAANTTTNYTLKFKVTVISSNTYIKSVSVIVLLILGTLITALCLSFLIGYFSRKRKQRLSSSSLSSLDEDVDINTNSISQQTTDQESLQDDTIVLRNAQNRMCTSKTTSMYLPPPYSSIQKERQSKTFNSEPTSTNTYVHLPPPYSSREERRSKTFTSEHTGLYLVPDNDPTLPPPYNSIQ